MTLEVIFSIGIAEPFLDLNFDEHKEALAQTEVTNAVFCVIIFLEECDCLMQAVERIASFAKISTFVDSRRFPLAVE